MNEHDLIQEMIEKDRRDRERLLDLERNGLMQPRLDEDPTTEDIIPTRNTKTANTQAKRQQQQAWQRFQQLQDRMVGGMEKATHIHPPIVYLLLGCVCLGFWALGTSAQVLTSEAWMMNEPLQRISFTAFGQLYDAVMGHLEA